LKTLLITEKPSVAQQFAQVLKVSGRKDGYIENDKFIITWCVGHLVTLSYPEKYDEKYKKWVMEDLPFIPAEYKYEVIQQTSKQYHIVADLLKRDDIAYIYNCGDSGREGEYIQRLVFEHTGTKIPIRRVWIDSQTEAEIMRGLREAKPSSAYDNLSEAAHARAIEDYGMGINLSRALSIKFGRAFNANAGTSSYKPIAVGRVMTCVLGMIVERERAIAGFTPTDYYKITATHGSYGFISKWKARDDSPFYSEYDLFDKSGFKEKVKAEILLEEFGKDGNLKVTEVKRTTSEQKAPLLFNLAELQSECTKRFKISPDTTLSIAQSLYEKKMTTYPRTDARVISTAVADVIETNLSGLKGLEGIGKTVEYIISHGMYKGIAKTKYCDDSKITDHYAIIPTGDMSAYAGLNDLERKVFDLICRRFVAVFCPPAEYAQTSVVLTHSNGEKFQASEKILIKKGFLTVYGKSEEDGADESGKDSRFASLKEGDVIPAAFSLDTATTTPPKRYTTGSMILAMENAGKLIEDEELREQIKGCGIGTSATRANILTKLQKNEYVEVNRKTQTITPSRLGESLYDIVAGTIPSMLSPETTANWEKGLSKIEKGEITRAAYLEKFNGFITRSIELIKSKEDMEVKKSDAGICPLCEQGLIFSKYGIVCKGKLKDAEKSCIFSLNNEYCGKKLSQSQLSAIARGETTSVIKGFKSKKTGKTFDAMLHFEVLAYEDSEGNRKEGTFIRHEFPPFSEKKRRSRNSLIPTGKPVGLHGNPE